MADKRRSLQDLIRGRQQSGFVGRQGQVVQHQENLGFAVDDERRRFLFNIYGDAGVGETYLTKQLRQIASDNGALTAYTDETVEDVTSAMTAIAANSVAAAPSLASSKNASPRTDSVVRNWSRTRRLPRGGLPPAQAISFGGLAHLSRASSMLVWMSTVLV